MQDLVFLFGDSITQESFNQDRGFGWAAQLSDSYIRRRTVVNAGLSGYSTDKALSKLPLLIQPPSHGRIRLMTIFFGANDSRLPDTLGCPQHVPLGQYRDNLRAIITHPKIKEHDAKIIVITPPPTDEDMWEAHDRSNGIAQRRRSAELTKAYAEAAREVGRETGVAVLDLWGICMAHIGWTEGDVLLGSNKANRGSESALATLLRDGLHFTPKGNELLYSSLMDLIAKTWPEESPDALPLVLPAWDDEAAWKDQ